MCGIDIDIVKKLDFIEFRQDLLFRNTELDRFLFEYNITRGQYNSIIDLMNKYKELIAKGKDVNHEQFEEDVYSIVINYRGNSYFAESLAIKFYKQGRYKDVFTSVYGHMPKFKSYLNDL